MRGSFQVREGYEPHLPLKNYPDPRVAIAQHLCWNRTTLSEAETNWSFPEPDNYNRAILSQRAIENKLVKYSVFYRQITTGLWWSIYYVPKEEIDRFDAWAYQQDWLMLWTTKEASKPKKRKTLLWAAKNAELTDNERLFCMGYYAKFKDKYLTDADDKMLLDRLGPIRDWVLSGPDEV